MSKIEKIIYKSTSILLPYANNSRLHNERQISQIASSIKEFGFTNPILIDKDNGIIAGHGRVLAAQQLGIESVPTIELGYLTETQKKAYIIADNKLALNAAWDEELLKLELEELKLLDFNIDLLGFDDEYLNDLLKSNEENTNDPDLIPDVPINPVTMPGDVWLLGDHRLMCGDSTRTDSIEKLMIGKKADMVFTDPPYGMSYGGGRSAGSTKKGACVKAHGMILNDDKTNDELISFIRDAIYSAVLSIKKGSSIYVCFTWRTYSEFQDALENIGLKISSCIVWNKKSIGLGYANYRPQHEFIFYIKGDSWFGDNAQSDIWSMSRDSTVNYVHPTQKPVELIEKAIKNSSKQGDLIIDIFGGSGSTLIACEKTERFCLMMELDQKYCDVIVKRWQDYTGKQAVLESNGESFNSKCDNL